MNNLLLVMLLCITTGTFSQTIQGKVAEKENKKGIPFASVYFTDYQLGVICDSTGRFELTADISNEKSSK